MRLGERRAIRIVRRDVRGSHPLRRFIIGIGALAGLLVFSIITAHTVAAAGVTATATATAQPSNTPVSPTRTPVAQPSPTVVVKATATVTSTPAPGGTAGALTAATTPAPDGSPTPAASPALPAATTTPVGTAIALPLQASPALTPSSITASPTAFGGSSAPPGATPTAPATPASTPATSATPTDATTLVILEDPGIGGDAAIARTAIRHYGEFSRADGVPWAGWCEMFVDNVLAEAGVPRPRFPTAYLDAASGPLYRGRAPAGSLVFFDQRSSPDGHVGIALGDGTMLSALANGIVRSAYESWPSYIGWRPYGTTSPQQEPFLIDALLTAPPAHEVPPVPTPTAQPIPARDTPRDDELP